MSEPTCTCIIRNPPKQATTSTDQCPVHGTQALIHEQWGTQGQPRSALSIPQTMGTPNELPAEGTLKDWRHEHPLPPGQDLGLARCSNPDCQAAFSPKLWSCPWCATPRSVTSAQNDPEVIDVPTAGTSDHPGAPVIYDPTLNKVWRGKPGDYHWDLIHHDPFLNDFYKNQSAELAAPDLNQGHIHGRIMGESDSPIWFNEEDNMDAVNRALGYSGDAEAAPDWNFTSANQLQVYPVQGQNSQRDYNLYRWRRPVVYSPETNAVIVGDWGDFHGDLTDHIMAKGTSQFGFISDPQRVDEERSLSDQVPSDNTHDMGTGLSWYDRKPSNSAEIAQALDVPESDFSGNRWNNSWDFQVGSVQQRFQKVIPSHRWSFDQA